MKTQIHYPTQALNALIYFLNTNLPYPVNGASYMNRFLKDSAEAFLKEVETAVKTLPPEELRGYAGWLNKRMSDFNCLFCEAIFDPITETHTVTELYPPINFLLLNDRNPELQQFKHQLCHNTISYQNQVVEYLNEKVWQLHPELKAGRNGK